MKKEESMVDVIVIGAGLSGLVAARRLDQAGISSVRVLEARGRVGGRTKVHHLISADRYVEEGGQLVGAEYKRLIALGEELGVTTWHHNEHGKSVFECGGKVHRFDGDLPWTADPLGSADFTQSLLRLGHLSKGCPREDELNTPEAGALDGRTFGSWVDRSTRTRFARALWGIISTLTLGAPPGEMSLLFVLRHLRAIGGVEALLASLSGGTEVSFTGGSAELSIRMAADLGERLSLETPTIAVRRFDDRVEVDTPHGTLQAGRVVIAMSPADAARIRVEPQLPQPQRSLTERLSMAHAFKVHVVYARPFWRDLGLSGASMSDSSPLTLTFDDTPPGAEQGVLVGFARADGPVLADLSDPMPRDRGARRRAVIGGLARAFGAGALDPIEYHEMHWDDEEWTTGCVPVWSPGLLTTCGPDYADPVGRVHFAGSETSKLWTGSMEGAVVAGERAAAEIIGAMAEDAPAAGAGRGRPRAAVAR